MNDQYGFFELEWLYISSNKPSSMHQYVFPDHTKLPYVRYEMATVMFDGLRAAHYYHYSSHVAEKVGYGPLSTIIVVAH
jgi:hypothetical protein